MWPQRHFDALHTNAKILHLFIYKSIESQEIALSCSRSKRYEELHPFYYLYGSQSSIILILFGPVSNYLAAMLIQMWMQINCYILYAQLLGKLQAYFIQYLTELHSRLNLL